VETGPDGVAVDGSRIWQYAGVLEADMIGMMEIASGLTYRLRI
jgi:hypothetical protein